MSDAYKIIRGDAIRVVKVIEENPGSFPLGHRKVYKCLPCKIEFDDTTEGGGVTITPAVDISRAIYCGNIRNNYIVLNAYYMVYRIGDKYVIDNQAAFLENQ